MSVSGSHVTGQIHQTLPSPTPVNLALLKHNICFSFPGVCQGFNIPSDLRFNQRHTLTDFQLTDGCEEMGVRGA